MIARVWRGVTRAGDADAYEEYIRSTGFAAYRRAPGNRGAWILKRIDGDRAEFITLSFWRSRAAITAFAGHDIDKAVYYPEDERFLIEREQTVRHYEVAGYPDSDDTTPHPEEGGHHAQVHDAAAGS